ncbi:hypothetical protein C8J57DRAFT_1295714 [Mycena rebaudengoi]|nr:hypothetical protein C8J57DRAFT_1295714 [Mycena rebaudengoi]
MRSLITVASVMTVVVMVMGSAMLRNFGGARDGPAAVLTALPLSKEALKIAYQDTRGALKHSFNCGPSSTAQLKRHTSNSEIVLLQELEDGQS